MCQIFFCPRDVPTREQLREANTCNPHGIGYAWVEDGRVQWSKGFDEGQVETVIDEFLEKEYPKAIHFRFATHGGYSMEMTHPFNITKLSAPALTGKSNSVLFHNGVWTDYDGLLIKGIVGGTIPSKVMKTPMSDSRAMAVLAGNFGEDFLDLMDFSGEKVLVLKGDRDYIRYGHWYEGAKLNDDVLWYHSNWVLTNTQKEPKKKGKTWKKINDNKSIHLVGESSKIPFNHPTGSFITMTQEEVEEAIERWEGHLG